MVLVSSGAVIRLERVDYSLLSLLFSAYRRFGLLGTVAAALVDSFIEDDSLVAAALVDSFIEDDLFASVSSA